MQDIKKFTLTVPNQITRENDRSATGKSYQYLTSEDGRDWYDVQSLYSDDTAKIEYDDSGIIRSVLSPFIGNGDLSVGLFWPINHSVAEVALENLPDGCNGDGSWMYSNGEISRYTPPVDPLQTSKKNQQRFQALLRAATDAAFPLQAAVDRGIATAQQQEMLIAIQDFAIELVAETDLTKSPVNWPPMPAGVKLPL